MAVIESGTSTLESGTLFDLGFTSIDWSASRNGLSSSLYLELMLPADIDRSIDLDSALSELLPYNSEFNYLISDDKLIVSFDIDSSEIEATLNGTAGSQIVSFGNAPIVPQITNESGFSFDVDSDAIAGNVRVSISGLELSSAVKPRSVYVKVNFDGLDGSQSINTFGPLESIDGGVTWQTSGWGSTFFANQSGTVTLAGFEVDGYDVPLTAPINESLVFPKSAVTDVDYEFVQGVSNNYLKLSVTGENISTLRLDGNAKLIGSDGTEESLWPQESLYGTSRNNSDWNDRYLFGQLTANASTREVFLDIGQASDLSNYKIDLSDLYFSNDNGDSYHDLFPVEQMSLSGLVVEDFSGANESSFHSLLESGAITVEATVGSVKQSEYQTSPLEVTFTNTTNQAIALTDLSNLEIQLGADAGDFFGQINGLGFIEANSSASVLLPNVSVLGGVNKDYFNINYSYSDESQDWEWVEETIPLSFSGDISLLSYDSPIFAPTFSVVANANGDYLIAISGALESADSKGSYTFSFGVEFGDGSGSWEYVRLEPRVYDDFPIYYLPKESFEFDTVAITGTYFNHVENVDGVSQVLDIPQGHIQSVKANSIDNYEIDDSTARISSEMLDITWSKTTSVDGVTGFIVSGNVLIGGEKAQTSTASFDFQIESDYTSENLSITSPIAPSGEFELFIPWGVNDIQDQWLSQPLDGTQLLSLARVNLTDTNYEFEIGFGGNTFLYDENLVDGTIGTQSDNSELISLDIQSGQSQFVAGLEGDDDITIQLQGELNGWFEQSIFVDGGPGSDTLTIDLSQLTTSGAEFNYNLYINATDGVLGEDRFNITGLANQFDYSNRAFNGNGDVIYYFGNDDGSQLQIFAPKWAEFYGSVGDVGEQVYSGWGQLFETTPAPLWLNAAGLNDSDYVNIALTQTTVLSDWYPQEMGSAGHEELSFADAPYAVYVDFNAGEALKLTSTGTVDVGYLNFTGFDGVEGSDNNDLIIGDDESNVLDGRKGDDIIDGGSGVDYVEYNWSDSSAGVTVNLSGVDSSDLTTPIPTSLLATDIAANTALDGTGGVDRVYNIEGFIGGAGDDFVIGNGANNLFFGGAGNDTFFGGPGEDTYYADAGDDSYYNNVGEWDRAIYSLIHESSPGAEGISVMYQSANDDGHEFASVVDGNSNTDTLRNIYRITGSIGNDSFLGSDTHATIFSGGQGDDFADFGLAGGSYQFRSTDQAQNPDQINEVAATQGVSVQVVDGRVYDTGALDTTVTSSFTDAWGYTDSAINVTGLHGTSLDDIIVFENSDANTFAEFDNRITAVGHAGSDVFDAFGASDTTTRRVMYIQEAGSQGITLQVLANNEWEITDTFGDADRVLGFNAIVASDIDDSIDFTNAAVGSEQTSALKSISLEAGDDTLTIDTSTLSGGAFYGGQGADTLVLNGAFANYTITSSEGADGRQRLNITDKTTSYSFDVVGFETLQFNNSAELYPLADFATHDLTNQEVFEAVSGRSDAVTADGVTGSISTGDMSDQITLKGAAGSESDPLIVNAGDGDDQLVIGNDFTGFAKVKMGYGDDSVRIEAFISEWQVDAPSVNPNGDVELHLDGGGIVLFEGLLAKDSSNNAWGDGWQRGTEWINNFTIDLSSIGLGDYSFENNQLLLGSNDRDQFDDLWDVTLDPIIAIGLSGNDDYWGNEHPYNIIFGDAGNDDLGDASYGAVIYAGTGDDVISLDGPLNVGAFGGAGDDLYLPNLGVTALSYIGSPTEYDGWPTVAADQAVATLFDTSGTDTLLVGADLPSIWNVAGSNDNGLKTVDSLSLGTNPFSFGIIDTIRIENDDLYLTFKADSSTLAAYKYIPSANMQWSWFPGDGHWDTNDQRYEFGMTHAEREQFDLADVTTYPGFENLNADAKQWLIDNLDVSEADFMSVVAKLAQQVDRIHDNTYDWDAAESTGNFAVNETLYNVAIANTSFDVSDYTTYPYLPFAQSLNQSNNLIPVESITAEDGNSIEYGFRIAQFASSDDTIERFMNTTAKFAEAQAQSDYSLIDREASRLFDAGKSLPEVVEGVLAWGQSNGYLTTTYFDQDGIAPDASADLFLVVNPDQVDSDLMLYATLDEHGMVQWSESEQLGYLPVVIPTDDNLMLIGGSGNDTLIGHNDLLNDTLNPSRLRDSLMGGAGDDWFEAYGGLNQLMGGMGNDVFLISDDLQYTSIVGGDWFDPEDDNSYIIDTNGEQIPLWTTWDDLQYQDRVLLNWEWNDSVSISGSNEHYRIERTDGSIIELFDVDTIEFMGGANADAPHVIDLSVFRQLDPWVLNVSESASINYKLADGYLTVFDGQALVGKKLASEVGDIEFTDSTVKVFHASDVDPFMNPQLSLTTSAGKDLVLLDTLSSTSSLVIYGEAGDDWIVGGAASSTVFGGDGDDVISTGAGDDVIYGDAGNDTLISDGTGSQTLDGGEGVDTFINRATWFTEAQLNQAYPLKVYANLDPLEGTNGQLDNPNKVESLISIENFVLEGSIDAIAVGAAGANTITLGSGDDEILVGHGAEDNDIVDGGLGADTVVYMADVDSVYVENDLSSLGYKLEATRSGVKVTHLATGSVDNLSNIEKLKFVQYGDASTDYRLNEEIAVIDLASYGFEKVELSAGDDTYFGSDGKESITTGGGADTIYAGAGNDYIKLTGDSTGGIKVFGESGDDIIEISSDFTGDAIIDAGIGADKLRIYSPISGTSIEVNEEAGTADGVITVLSGDTTSTIRIANQFTLSDSGAFVVSDKGLAEYSVISIDDSGNETSETFTFAGSTFGSLDADVLSGFTEASEIYALAGDDTVTGSDFADRIDGGSGDDIIKGGAGDDFIVGGFGDDVLDGQAGDDQLYGGDGDDTYIHTAGIDAEDNGLDTIFESTGGDNDAVVITPRIFDPSGDLTNPFDNANKGFVLVDDGDFVFATGNSADDLTNGIVIDSFADKGADGEYINTVEKLILPGREYRLDPDGVISSDDPEGDYFLVGFDNGMNSGYSEILGGSGNDRLYGSKWDLNLRDILDGGEGSDILNAQGGENILIGGSGNDEFFVWDTDQFTQIVGDTLLSDAARYSKKTPLETANGDWTTDTVKIGWTWEESLVETILGDDGAAIDGAYRITKLDEFDQPVSGQVVEIYDVEQVKFWDADKGSFKDFLLTKGNPVTSEQYLGDYKGTSLDFDRNEVEFRFGNGEGDSDIIQLWARPDVKTTEITTETYVYYQRGSRTRSTPARGYTKKTGTREVEVDVAGLAEEPVLVWEGDRFTVSRFDFESISDVKLVSGALDFTMSEGEGKSVNVTNIIDDVFLRPLGGVEADASQASIVVGSEGMDIIFGDDNDNIIDGRGGDDYIFGGAGDDVLVGGFGDDMLLGGDGQDVLRGDLAEDELLASSGLSDVEYTSETALFGDDLLIGGEGIDDLNTGQGNDVAATDRVDRVDADGNQAPDGEADLATINDAWVAQDEVLNDDGWV